MGTFAYHADNPKMSAITGNTVISGGRRSNQPFCHCYGVKNPKWKKTNENGHFYMYTYNMWEIPEGMKVSNEIGVMPAVMDFYIHFKSDMFFPVVDYGLAKTPKGELAWIVFEQNDDFSSPWVYAHFERRKRQLYAHNLFNPLIKLIPELERIEDYFHGGGVYSLGPELQFCQHDGIVSDLIVRFVPFASFPNQGLFELEECDQTCNSNLAMCMAPETRTAHYDRRADVFSLARLLSWWECGNFWRFDDELKQMPFDDAFRISCERQIEMGLDGIGSHVMEKALAFNPEDRYQTLSEFFEALA